MVRQGDEMVAANFLSGEKIEGDGCGYLGLKMLTVDRVLNHHDQGLLLAPVHENGYALIFTDI